MAGLAERRLSNRGVTGGGGLGPMGSNPQPMVSGRGGPTYDPRPNQGIIERLWNYLFNRPEAPARQEAQVEDMNTKSVRGYTDAELRRVMESEHLAPSMKPYAEAELKRRRSGG